MLESPPGLQLPRNLDDVDASFMTTLLRARGLIDSANAVVSTEESGVGMTAGYFSSIKRVKCNYKNPVDVQDSFIVKAWPEFEIAPGEDIADLFAKDIKGYLVDSASFYPRPKVYLADFDLEQDRWALVMEDACTFSDQMLHENEMNMDQVRRMIPKLVDVAVAWEGCDEGELSSQLDAMDVRHWASDSNLAIYLNLMPGGAKLYDYGTSLPDSSLTAGRTWHDALGPKFIELFTNKLQAHFESIKPQNGGTCTLSHGDLRGDNLFQCEPTEDYPNGWLTIDFQLLFRGPVPSDLAYILNSGSVLPEVYGGENREALLREFYDQFMAKTKRYPDYTWEQCQFEYSVMASVLFVYYVGFGAAIWQAGIADDQPARVELGTKGETEADLAPDELRKRMWWCKALANFRATFKEFGYFEHLKSLPDNTMPMGEWFELPDRLKS